jgi:hypothetical protein
LRTLMKKYGWTEPFFPMNVKNSDQKMDALFADDNYIAELKRDGSRYVCIDGRFFSRKPSENKKTPELLGLPVEKTANVPHLSEVLAGFGSLGIITDGEAYFPGLKSNHTTSIMGCDRDKALMRQGFGFAKKDVNGNLVWAESSSSIIWTKVDKDSLAIIQSGRGKIHYMIFDLLFLNGLPLEDLPWTERRAILEKWYFDNIQGTPAAEFIHISAYVIGEQAKRGLLKWAEDGDEEGIMFKNRQATYKRDKRPEHHWYRVKGKITADVVIMGYTDGEPGKFFGMVGSVVFGLVKDGVLTEAGTCSGMDDALRKLFTEDRDSGANAYIGKVMQITAMERTEKGKFRHPQFDCFRDDKAAMQCLWENEIDE